MPLQVARIWQLRSSFFVLKILILWPHIDKYTNIDAERLKSTCTAKSKHKRWLMVNQAGSFSNLRLDPADVEHPKGNSDVCI